MNTLKTAIDDLRKNDQQWQAFETQSPCVVLAPPGSGKTKLLATRLAYDLLARIPEPHGAACITMTNAAADQLADRIARLGVKPRSNLFVGTVHGFAMRCIVKPFAALGGMSKVAEATLASEHNEDDVRARAVKEIFGGNEDPNALDLVTTLRQRRNLMDYGEATRELGGERFARLAARYDELLLESGHYDFADLVRFAVSLVERNEWIQRVLVARFPHIYVDEYQDLAPGLDRLVQALCFDQRANAELFAVGDPDQAIYGFSGTRPELLRQLAARPGVNDVSLEWNYRNPQRLIDAAIRHLGEDRKVHGRADGGEIDILECPGGLDQQLAELRRVVAAERSVGTTLDHIGVVTRSNKALDLAVVDLGANHIPVFARRERGYRSSPATALIEAMAAWSVQPRDGRGVGFGDIVRRLRGTVGADQSGVARYVQAMLAYRHRADAPAIEFAEAILSLGFRSALKRSVREDDEQQVERMVRALSNGGSLGGTTVGELGLRARARDRLLVSTVHGVKGLEFDAVIILEVEDGVMPFFKAQSPAALAEERRTFYVAITRARKRVYCLWSPWKMTRYGRRQNGPSPYLRQLRSCRE